MIDLKCRYNNNDIDKFVIKIDDTYTIFANNIEDFKRELFDYIELQIDRLVLSKLDKLEEKQSKDKNSFDDLDAWLRGL